MRLSPIKGGGNVRCKKCNDGTLAEYFVYFAAAKKEIPLCRQCAIDITTVFDLKVLQAVHRGEII